LSLKEFLSKKFNVRKNYVKLKNIKVNANSQQNVKQKPSDVDVEEKQPIQIYELDRLENYLAQQQEEVEVDCNNNNLEQVDYQNEIQRFIVNEQQQQSDSNFVKPNDFLTQLPDLDIRPDNAIRKVAEITVVDAYAPTTSHTKINDHTRSAKADVSP
jgi:hypothetical protein